MTSLFDRLKLAMSQITNKPRTDIIKPKVGGVDGYVDEDNKYKAVITDWIYNPPYGYPLGKDIVNIRRLAKTPYVEMAIKTIVNQVSTAEWNIKAKEGQDIPEEIIEMTKNFFYNPNRNEESFEYLLSCLTRDILEIDAGVAVKVRNLKDEFVEMYVRDGATFLKAPNVYGVLPDIDAYFQYGWSTNSHPVPFNRNEIVYIIGNPRADSIYGQSPVEVLLSVIQMLSFGIDYSVESYSNNSIPKGILSLAGADTDSVEQFTKVLSQQLRTKDTSGNWRRKFFKIPVVGTESKFTKFDLTNEELQFIAQQEWFSKIVWATFGITPSELGFTEDSNRATDVNQSAVFKRKTIQPLLSKIEYYFNTQIINDLVWIKGKYEDKVILEFNRTDVAAELAKRQVQWGDLKHKIKTINEIREEENLEAIEEGKGFYEERNPMFDGFSNFQKQNNSQDNNQNNNQDNNKKQEIKAYTTADIQKKDYNEKALTTASPLSPKEFEEMIKPEYAEKLFENEIKKKREIIILAIKKKSEEEKIIGLKASYIDSIVQLFSLDNIKGLITKLIKANFYQAEEEVAIRTNRNFQPNTNAIDFLQNYTFENIKGMEEDTRNKLRQELSRGIMNSENTDEIVKRINEVFDITEVRAKAIANTEINRARNMGSLDAFRQSGLVVNKTWTNLSPESDMCKKLEGKTIEINKKFKYKGEEFDSPPGHVNCFDDKTEVYTEQGWKLFKDIENKNIKIWALNPTNHIPEWVNYVNFIKQKEDEIVEYKGNSFDLAVSKNHNQYVKFRKKQKGRNDAGKWKLVKDKDLPNHDFNFLKGINWKGISPETILIGEKVYPIHQFVKFMGWYLSEGSTIFKSKNYAQIKISQYQKENIEQIKQDIDGLADNIKEWKGGVFIMDSNLARYTKQFGYSYQKYIPDEIKELTPELIREFLDAYCLGDGTIAKGKFWKGYQFNDSKAYFTSSTRMSEDLGELILKVGKTPSFRLDKTKGKQVKFKNGTYTINHDMWYISENSRIYTSRDNLSRETKPYGRFVYDVELEKYHILLVRRNGKIVWSGNCRSFLTFELIDKSELERGRSQ